MGLTDIFFKLFDPYERQARLYPSLMIAAPVAVVFICLAAPDKVWSSTLISVLVGCGAAYALGRVARDAGKRLQDELFAKWGGPPTTQLLRHGDTMIDAHTKARYHKVLANGIGKDLPTPEAETADPKAADDFYRAGTTWLLGQTRDTKAFPLVFKENIAFGFHRNALGLRRLGTVVSMLSFLAVLTSIARGTGFAAEPSLDALTRITTPQLVALAVSLVFSVVWIFGLNEAALRRTAFAYALRLFESCDRLPQPKVPAVRKSTAPPSA
jgi:hypothetical protein